MDTNLLVENLRKKRDWVAELENLTRLIEKLDKMGSVTSTRELSSIIDRSKSWVGVSVLLIKGLKVYPEIEKLKTRNEAYVFLLKKSKLRRFLES